MITEGQQLITTSRGLKMVFKPRDLIGTTVQQTGEWEPDVARLIEHFSRSDWTFLDIGAHVGYFSLIASKCYKSVVAVEPNPEMYQLLQENISLNNIENVVTHRFAIGDLSSHGYLTIDDKDVDNPGAAYISNATESSILISITSLEKLGVSANVVKIDVEGMEYDILYSNSNPLKNADVIIFEVSPAQAQRYGHKLDELYDLIRSYGFEIYQTDGSPLENLDLYGWQYSNLIATKSKDFLSVINPRAALTSEWRDKNPSTPEAIHDFYVNSDNIKGALDSWHGTKDRQLWTQLICAAAVANKSVRILDIGAGAGHDLRALRDQNPDYVLEAVEPNDIARRAIEADGFLTFNTMQDVDSAMPFDMIICMDVLEHLSDPEGQVLEPMLKHLRMGGIFIESTATHDTGDPLHLSSLRGWSASRFLDRHGFVITEEFFLGRFKIWIRLFDKRPNSETLLLCAYRDLSAETSGSIMRLVDAGWRRSIHRGDALVSRVRSLAVSQWLQGDDGDVFLMVDADIIFEPEDAKAVVELARRTRSIASAAYPVRGATHLASRLFEGNCQFGRDLEPIEIQWAGTGFIAAHRDVCEAIAATMPLCIMSDQLWFWPIFQPFPWFNDKLERWEYLSEDWAFCERARQLGFKIWLDRSVILRHLGAKEYTVFDLLGASFDDAPVTDGRF